MNRVCVTPSFYVDLDEFVSMEIAPFEFVERIGDLDVLKKGYQVEGVTKQGVKYVLFKHTKSEQDDSCKHFIAQNWVNVKK